MLTYLQILVTDNLLTNSLDRFRGTSPVRHDAFLLEESRNMPESIITFGAHGGRSVVFGGRVDNGGI